MGGKLSGLVDLPSTRTDWSQIRKRLRKLEPSDKAQIVCPSSMNIKAFRSGVLMVGKRIDYGEWRLSTRTQGRLLHCFLVPKTEIL